VEGLLLTMGIAAAAFERSISGHGQVIDAAMVDGAALVLGPFFAAASSGFWGPRGTNQLDGGAHFYQVYETADGGWIAVGAIEPQFYAAFLDGLGLPADTPQWDQSAWPELKDRIAAIVRGRTRDEWCEVFDGTEACVAPVLAPGEVPSHPHTAARGTVIELNGVPQAQAAPRFSRTPAAARPPCHPGGHQVGDILTTWP
jgi:alpha-methylacyl-CoA racemase